MKDNIWIGIDVGGTKISAGLVDKSGKILATTKLPTPLKAKPAQILVVIKKAIQELCDKKNIKINQIKGIGLGIPGIVGNDQTSILVTPNINLAGFPLAKTLKNNFKVKVVLGNDVNLGLLAEKWLGAGRGAKNVIGIFPGTGVGGGMILDDKLITGAQGAAAEIGHMIMDINGPMCSCGNHGCLEALTSRWAIEREIRLGIKNHEKTIISELTKGNLNQIKSGVIKEALFKKDPLTIKVITRATEILGKACVSIKHIFNPDMIILGGGLIEACGDFMFPILRKTVIADPFFRDIDNCKILGSQLGDDAVILGAAILAKGKIVPARLLKESIFPEISLTPKGILVNGKSIKEGLFIRADGKLKRIQLVKKDQLTDIGLPEIEKFCRKKPKIFLLGRKGNKPNVSLPALRYLEKEKIELKILPLGSAIETYRKVNERKAMVLLP